jgi:hypothetical protein
MPSDSFTPEDELFTAVARGDAAKIEELVAQGIDVDAHPNYDDTALCAAAGRGRLEIVKLLVEAGADVNKRGYREIPPLTRAALARENPLDVAAYLLERGADANARSHEMHATALMLAALEGRAQVMELLAARGADPSLTDRDGRTAQDYLRRREELSEERPGHVPNDKLRLEDVPPADADWTEHAAFAHGFFGYEEVPSLAAVANAASKRFRETGEVPAALTELRACLFFEHRRAVHFGAPTDAMRAYGRALLAAIRERVARGALE